MTILFSQNCIVKRFDEQGLYRSKLVSVKDYDGPNNFSLLWNQLIILWQNELFSDSNSLKTKYNPILLKRYSKNISQEIDTILYKFSYLNMRSITLYYDTYQLKNNLETIRKLYDLKTLLKDL
jgi:hypothetical protein|tara:strand:+ start:37 stop:405 length:369 start_codon:yes stop_codon:yes gene_type:complete